MNYTMQTNETRVATSKSPFQSVYFCLQNKADMSIEIDLSIRFEQFLKPESSITFAMPVFDLMIWFSEIEVD